MTPADVAQALVAEQVSCQVACHEIKAVELDYAQLKTSLWAVRSELSPVSEAAAHLERVIGLLLLRSRGRRALRVARRKLRRAPWRGSSGFSSLGAAGGELSGERGASFAVERVIGRLLFRSRGWRAFRGARRQLRLGEGHRAPRSQEAWVASRAEKQVTLHIHDTRDRLIWSLKAAWA